MFPEASNANGSELDASGPKPSLVDIVGQCYIWREACHGAWVFEYCVSLCHIALCYARMHLCMLLFTKV